MRLRKKKKTGGGSIIIIPEAGLLAWEGRPHSPHEQASGGRRDTQRQSLPRKLLTVRQIRVVTLSTAAVAATAVTVLLLLLLLLTPTLCE